MISFAGNQTGPVKEAFADFLSQPHDHKGAQLGDFIYSNGSVRPCCFAEEPQFTKVKQVSFGLSLFYDGPEPPAGLYDELLNLAYTTRTIYQGNFTGWISGQFLPAYDR